MCIRSLTVQIQCKGCYAVDDPSPNRWYHPDCTGEKRTDLRSIQLDCLANGVVKCTLKCYSLNLGPIVVNLMMGAPLMDVHTLLNCADTVQRLLRRR